jgi:hypothetical protein
MAEFAQRLGHTLMKVLVEDAFGHAATKWQENSHYENSPVIGGTEPFDVLKKQQPIIPAVHTVKRLPRIRHSLFQVAGEVAVSDCDPA